LPSAIGSIAPPVFSEAEIHDLARSFWEELERLDPGNGHWASLSDYDRRLYVEGVRHLLKEITERTPPVSVRITLWPKARYL